MLPVASRIPDAAMRDRFADRLAHRARVTDDVVRAEIRRVAVNKQTLNPAKLPSFGRVTKAEKGLLWGLMHHPERAFAALEGVDPADFDGLSSRTALDLARKLNEDRGFSPSALLERLGAMEAQLVTTIASEPEPPALELSFCVREIQRARYERERAALQREIDRLQSSGATNSTEMNALLVRTGELGRLIQALVLSED